MRSDFRRRLVLWAGILAGMAVLGQGLGSGPDITAPPGPRDNAPQPAPKTRSDDGAFSAPSLRAPATESAQSATPAAQPRKAPRTASLGVPSTTAKSRQPKAGGRSPGLLAGHTVCLDPGHQARPDLRREPVGPGSTVMKLRATVGASGIVTRMPEHRLTLILAKKLAARLRAEGARVVLARSDERPNISNASRAQLCSRERARLFLRIHADGSTDRSRHGFSVLHPANNAWTAPVYAESLRAALLVRRELARSTGALDLGLKSRGDLTGFNWSRVPVVLAEVGYLSNPQEDKLLAAGAYQDRIVAGLGAAVRAYLTAGSPPG